MAEYSARNKAPKSHIRDRSLCAHLVSFFGEMELAEITPSLIAEYKTKRREEGASAKTVNNELILMSHAFNLAIRDWEWVKNPVKKVSKEKVNNQIERWLTKDEEKRLLASSPKWLKEIIVFALNTGLRQSEILNLQWSQIDFKRKTLTIPEQKNKEKDTILLNKKALEILMVRWKLRKNNPADSGYVFLNKNYNKLGARNLIRAFSSALEKAKIENFRFHDLRHTFATRLVQAGVDIYKV